MVILCSKCMESCNKTQQLSPKPLDIYTDASVKKIMAAQPQCQQAPTISWNSSKQQPDASYPAIVVVPVVLKLLHTGVFFFVRFWNAIGIYPHWMLKPGILQSENVGSSVHLTLRMRTLRAGPFSITYVHCRPGITYIINI